jgi:hypothetical protein
MNRAPLALLLALVGCGWQDAREARNGMTSPIIGMTVPDLISCMGKPTSVQQTGPETAILQYDHKDASAALKATVALIGSISIGGGGGCSAVFTIIDGGRTVADVTFPGAYDNGLLSVPYESCRPLVSECLAHPGDTGPLPKGDNPLEYFLPAKPK